MALNAQYQTGTYTRTAVALSAQSMVEIKFSAQDLGEAVAVYPQISLNSCEVSSGRVNYSGRLIATLVYTGEDGKLCRVQKGAEFSHYCDNEALAPAQRADCVLTCAKCQVKRDGSSYVVAVVADAEITVYDSAQRSYLSSLEGAVCRTESGVLYSPVSFYGESEVDDDFDCVADDVLVPSAQALVLDCNVKTGAVEVSGEIYLSLLAIREGTPVNLDRTIPFKCEISCDEALLSRRAYCRAEIKNVTVNCKIIEDRGKCGVDFNAELGFTGHFFEEEEISYVADAFCKESEVELSSYTENTVIDTDVKVYSERVNGLCATKAKLDYTCAFLAAALPSAEYARTADGIEGSITATLIYEQGGEVRSTEINMPFDLKLSGLGESCNKISVAVCGVSLRQRAEGECEGEAALKITAFDGENRALTYVTSAEEGGEKPSCNSAVSVYIPKAGDGLWETAKRLSESPENISKSNPELTFPLTGKERIIIYRPKVN
ncbi:MAG: DUF3794 domain-containing protein [Clostridia bacterium]|nr:DUF3794 domain-containing protein [Clostridia bacterium]